MFSYPSRGSCSCSRGDRQTASTLILIDLYSDIVRVDIAGSNINRIGYSFDREMREANGLKLTLNHNL